MKKELKNILRSLSIVIMAIVVVVGVAYATTGSFTPPTGTTANYRTLGDIHAKLTNFNLNPSATHSVSTTTSPAGSFYTLGDIYGLLTAENPDLVPSNIKSGVNIFGISGTYTGTSGDNGPITVAPAPPAGPICFSNTLIGSFLSGTQCNTSQIYSMNSGWGAVEYCAHLNANGLSTSTTVVGIWRLPTASIILDNLPLFINLSYPGAVTSTYTGGYSAFGNIPLIYIWNSSKGSLVPAEVGSVMSRDAVRCIK